MLDRFWTKVYDPTRAEQALYHSDIHRCQRTNHKGGLNLDSNSFKGKNEAIANVNELVAELVRALALRNCVE